MLSDAPYVAFVASRRKANAIFHTLRQRGLKIRPEFAAFDAVRKFGLAPQHPPENRECIAGQVLKGLKKPTDCPHFGKKCIPSRPLGAPMVSSEGACAAYYHFARAEA